MSILLPSLGALISVEIPPGCPGDVVTLISRTVVNAPYAVEAKGKPIVDAANYGRAIATRYFGAWRAGGDTWSSARSAAHGHLQRLRGLRPDRSRPSSELVLDHLLTPGDDRSAEVEAILYGVIGHGVGGHEPAVCRSCEAAAQRHYYRLMKLAGLDAVTLDNLYRSLIRSGDIVPVGRGQAIRQPDASVAASERDAETIF